jgi:hypothetical protein
MLKAKRMKNITAAGLLLLFTMGSALHGAHAAKPADNTLLRLLPAESMFCIRVNHFEHTVNQIDQFLAGISPMPMGLSMLTRMQLARVLGSPDLKGVNMSGSAAIFGAIIPGEQRSASPVSDIFVGGLVPLTDYRQFVSGNPSCSRPDNRGVSEITINGNPTLLAKKIDRYALVAWASDYDKLLKMANTISAAGTPRLVGSIDTAEAKKAIFEPVWIYGNVQYAYRTFEPLILGKIEQIKTIIKSTGPKQTGTASNAQKLARNAMNMYTSILQKLMKESKYFSITVNPKPDVLNITKTVCAVPRTDMANMLVSDESADGRNNLLHYLDDGAVLNLAVRMNKSFWKELNLKGADLFSMMAGEKTDPEDIEKMKELMTHALDCLEGPMACSVSVDPKNKPPFRAKYVMDVRNKDKFNLLIEQTMELFNTSSIMNLYKDMGLQIRFDVERDVDTYQNISTNSAKLTMKSTDTASPQAQMLNAMYGAGFDYRWATVNGLCLLTIGGNADSSIRNLIDRVKTGPTQIESEMKSALEMLPEPQNADFVVTYNILRWFKIVGSMTVMPVPIPKMDIPTKSNIVFAGRTGSGKMTVDIALPKTHLTEIMTAFIMMQQQMKTIMQQNSSPPGGKVN